MVSRLRVSGVCETRNTGSVCQPGWRALTQIVLVSHGDQASSLRHRVHDPVSVTSVPRRRRRR